MAKRDNSTPTLAGDVRCLENLVVAYNTVFLMSSIFVISIAATAQQWFGDFNRLLSPTVLLLIISVFIVFLALVGYTGVAKRSSTLISTYTLLLIFVFLMEISAGVGVLSFRREIKSYVTQKMTKAMHNYTNDLATANLVDYVQIELRCCGVNSYWDWDAVLGTETLSTCRVEDVTLPQSCCRRIGNSPFQSVNTKGCYPSVSYLFHSSALFLSASLIAICALQILGAYFSYSLSMALQKHKLQLYQQQQQEQQQQNAPPPRYETLNLPENHNDKTNYF